VPTKIVDGMFSPYDQQAVMSGLGDKFLNGLAWSVRGTQEDLAELREWKPAWFSSMSGRCLANLIHDRLWARLVVSVGGNPDIETIDREPVREMWISQNYQVRIKRHHPDDKISIYPTAAALEFWAQGSQLPSLEAITLGVGYRWIAEERRVGPAVISYRDGKDNPIWVVCGELGITQATLSRYENDQRLPDGETLAKFAQIYGVTVDFLQYGQRMQGALAIDSHMRRQKTTKATLWRRLEARLNMYRLHTSLLFEEVSLQATSIIPTFDPEETQPTAAALMTRAQWRMPIGPVLHLIRWLEAA
jgi:transcriptional regulator with XRE-family HTH domain